MDFYLSFKKKSFEIFAFLYTTCTQLPVRLLLFQGAMPGEIRVAACGVRKLLSLVFPRVLYEFLLARLTRRARGDACRSAIRRGEPRGGGCRRIKLIPGSRILKYN